MPGFDLDRALAIRQQANRKAGVGMFIVGFLGCLVLLVIAFGIGAALSDPLAGFFAAAGLSAFLLPATVYFYFHDAEISVREERSMFEQLTGNNAIAFEYVIAFLLVIPKTTAEGLRDLANARGLADELRTAAREIATQLHDLNDWRPVQHYAKDQSALSALIRLDILRVKEVHGKRFVRLNPSLYE